MPDESFDTFPGGHSRGTPNSSSKTGAEGFRALHLRTSESEASERPRTGMHGRGALGRGERVNPSAGREEPRVNHCPTRADELDLCVARTWRSLLS
jgi:hypothetical protein